MKLTVVGLFTCWMLFCGIVLSTTGCDKKKPPPPDLTDDGGEEDNNKKKGGDGPKPVAGEYQGGPVNNGGTLEGVVTWGGGDAKPYLMFDYSVAAKEKDVCGKQGHDANGKRANQRLKLGAANGGKQGVADVVVWLEIKRGKAMPAPGTISFANSACEFDPHVFLVPNNSKLQVTTSDPLAHNAKVDYVEDGMATNLFNKQLGAGAQPYTHDELPKKARLQITCSQHYWMGAIGVIHEHPYYVVTGKDGRFKLTDIPAGSYKLHFWHEAYKPSSVGQAGTFSGVDYQGEWKSTQQVTIEKGKTANVTAEMK